MCRVLFWLKECVNIGCSLNLTATMWASASVFLLLVHGTASKPQYGQVSIETETRVRICKRLRSPGIDSEELILPAYVALRAGTTKRVVVPARQAGNRFLGSLKGLQIRLKFESVFGMSLSISAARLHTVHWRNRFLGS
jgi:hypothetical protein